jgi:hypothetical protein
VTCREDLYGVLFGVLGATDVESVLVVEVVVRSTDVFLLDI